MPTLSEIYIKDHPYEWQLLKRLPDDQYKKVMLSFDISDAVIDFLLDGAAADVKRLALKIDNICIEHIKK